MLDHQRENLLVSPQLSAPMAWHTADIIQATHQQIQHLIPQSCDAGVRPLRPSDHHWVDGKSMGNRGFWLSNWGGSWIVNVPFCQMDFSENRVLPNWHFIVMSPWKTHLVRYWFLTNPNLRSNNKISFPILSYKRNGCGTEECSRDIPTEDV